MGVRQDQMSRALSLYQSQSVVNHFCAEVEERLTWYGGSAVRFELLGAQISEGKLLFTKVVHVVPKPINCALNMNGLARRRII